MTGAIRPAPLIAFFGGYDATLEEIYFVPGEAAQRRSGAAMRG